MAPVCSLEAGDARVGSLLTAKLDRLGEQRGVALAPTPERQESIEGILVCGF